MEDLLNFSKALSDETRLRIMILLSKRNHCVCELTEILNLSQPKVSKHLNILKSLNFVHTTKDARYVIYHLNIEDSTLQKILNTIAEDKDNFSILKADSLKAPSCMVGDRR